MTAVVPELTDTEALAPATVLFVDEEEGVLAGLRATLRRNPAFRALGARSLAEALAIVEEVPVDVLVTEIRLGGRDGIDLLKAVRATSPTTVRYVLTGEVGEDSVIRAATVAHRWLSKPCSREQMLDALDDAVRHQRIIADPTLRHAITNTAALPTPPRLYTELLNLVGRPDSTIDEIAELVAQDASVAAKLLQWANSAYVANRPIVDLKAAVIRIGLSALSQLVLLAEVAVAFDSDDSIPGFHPSLFGHHTGRISGYASRISGYAEATADDAVCRLAGTGGLFANIGLLLEASHLPDRLTEAYAVAQRDDISLLEAESRLFGVTHPEIGAHLLSLWGVPSDLVLLVAGSHKPPANHEPVTAVDAVRIARLLAQRVDRRRLGSPHVDRCDPEVEAIVTKWANRLDVEIATTSETATTRTTNRSADQTVPKTNLNGATPHG